MAKARAPTSLAGRVLAVMAVVLWVMLRSAEAATYIVGDATNWNNVANAASFYSTWASNHTFQVNDTLVFNFISGQHDVAVVSESNFASCTTNSPINLYTTPPVNYTLNATGAVYFICTHDSHCSQGQKLSITVGTASGPTTSPSPPSTTTPSPSPPPPPPPPSNSSTTAPSPPPPPPPPSNSSTTAPSPPPPPPPPSNSGTRFMFASCRAMFISMAICLLMMS